MFIPTKPGKYYCQPFWNGKHQPRQIIECYLKICLIQEDVGPRKELVCDYGGYSHLVCLTKLNRWENHIKKRIIKNVLYGEKQYDPDYNDYLLELLQCPFCGIKHEEDVFILSIYNEYPNTPCPNCNKELYYDEVDENIEIYEYYEEPIL